jgi:hypothetical protein
MERLPAMHSVKKEEEKEHKRKESKETNHTEENTN